MKKTKTPRLILAAGLLVLPMAAQADIATMNYGDLQELFGEPVTTSATGTPQRASETPVNMTIITAEEIRQSGTRSLAQILARVPGLDILQTGSTVFDVGVRGYQQPFQPRLLVLVDGRQVFIDDYSRTLWDNIPVNIDDIRQIEVVKGAASALFGSNAAGGVVNIVTYSPLYDHNTTVTTGMGTQKSVFGDATATANGQWGGTKFSAGGLDQREFNTSRYDNDTLGYNCCDQSPTFRPHHQYATNSSVFNLSSDVKLNTEFTYAQSVGNSGDPTGGFIMGSQVATTMSGRVGGSWDSSVGLLTMDNYYNRSLISMSEMTDGGTPYTFSTNLMVSQIADQFKVGAANTVHMEIEYRYKTFLFGGAQNFSFRPVLAETNMAVSTAVVHNFNEKLTGTIAGRFDHLAMQEIGSLLPGTYYGYADYSHDLNASSINADLTWKAGDLDTLKGGYGRGIQMPSFMQSQYGQVTTFTGQNSDYPGNPDLKPTIVQDFRLDYAHQIPSLSSTLTLSPYYELNQDMVAPFTAGGTEILQGQTYYVDPSGNMGNSTGWGGEIELKGTRDGLRWDLSYSLSQVSDPVGFKAAVISYAHSAPNHHLRAWLGYGSGPWSVDGNIQYLSATDMLRSADGGNTEQFMPVSAYVSIGGRVGYSVTPNLTVAISGTNIQCATVNTSPYPEVERQVLGTVTMGF